MNTKLNSNSPEIVAWIAALTQRNNAAKAIRFPSLNPEAHVCERGTKFLAIDHMDSVTKHNRSVFCFIAADDGESRTMGAWKRGDIFKAAGYKAPAKHVRGNIFNTDPLSGTGQYGCDYLR
jgi:hypothetical protein